ncbi:MAG: aminotransferase class III-fold pyridoxal phosphate-dependent enzyme [Acidimicrobiales bacterium]
MIKAAAANGWIDRHLVAMEHLTSIKRRRRRPDPHLPGPRGGGGAGMTTNEALFEAGAARRPGGVNSPVRAFRSVGGTPVLRGPRRGRFRVWDVEGTEYLDLVQSYGAVIASHAPSEDRRGHPGGDAGDGTSYGAPPKREVLLAGEEIGRRVPSCEKVRMVSSGTEATMTALRLARGATGRNRVVKFAGNYHGHGDALLAESGSAVAHLDPAHSPGGPGLGGAVGEPSPTR